MAVSRDDLIRFLDSELKIREFRDTSLNGLQIEGRSTITKVATAVDAGESLIEKSVSVGADLLFVHHGLFWGSPLAVRGAHGRVVRKSVAGELNLYAAHLPLDAHQEWGNNFLLARRLRLSALRPAAMYDGVCIGCCGENASGLSFDAMVRELGALEGAPAQPVVLAFGPKVPRSVCVVSGGGADTIRQAESEGFDTLVTGEPKQSLFHFAKERGLNVVCAGHYATETVGVQAVGAVLAERFGLEHVFISEPTGI